MANIDDLVCPHIKEFSRYQSAKNDVTKLNAENKIFLDANENPFGNHNRYPDPYQVKLKKRIGKIKDIPPGQIFLSNGSDEIIDLLFKVFCVPGSDNVMIFDPTFEMYETSAQINNSGIIKIPLTESFHINLDDVKHHLTDPSLKLIFICSPNNPTGNTFRSHTIQYLLENFDGIIVLDEAYIDFSQTTSWLDSLPEYTNLIILQTLSKAWGLANLRLGMAFADPAIIHYLNKVKPPYNISSVIQQMALDRLDNTNSLRKQIGTILSERKRVADALDKIDIIKTVYPSNSNFLLVEVDNADRIHSALIDRRIIVRNRSKQVGQCLRITIGTPDENDLLISTLNKIDK